MIRLGLCCIFIDEPVKYHYTTLKIIKSFKRREDQLQKLSGIALSNSKALVESVKNCKKLGIGAFRVLSQILPIYSHPEFGYNLDDLPNAAEIRADFAEAGRFARENDIRLSFHPDQFNIIASPREEVFINTIRELSYQCMVADLIGADNVNIHMGGVYGDKAATLRRFVERFKQVPDLIKRHLTLENDDVSYNVEDLYPVCMETGVPLIYDVHHHRCLPDRFDIKEATAKSFETWNQVNREPHFHISSPREGWKGKNPRIHAEYIDIKDFPAAWIDLKKDFTLDIEAVAKELAVKKLTAQLKRKGVSIRP
ncbi:UV DNA damage repair endonuclease UvsE [Lentisphaerota bacterium ZTH]|nr:UV DNA damage repair endonuclease UvsE [Lentisphaerota bacterium]WET05196.1 UV DNA damage repair endonuclease UvsE [Lentisphaerota bacterium ZTH]